MRFARLYFDMKTTKFGKYWLYLLGLPKSIIFNFYYFPISTAIKLPVLLSHRVYLKKLSGCVKLVVVKPGVVKIGFGDVGIFDAQKSRSIWNVTGKVVFGGRALLGHGSKISVSGELVLGNMFTISAESTIVAEHQVVFGDNVMLSWDILIMDSDIHSVFDKSNNLVNPCRPICIGDNVWIGCRSLILKGSVVADGVIVAAGTKIAGKVESNNSIISNNSAVQLLKEEVFWLR